MSGSPKSGLPMPPEWVMEIARKIDERLHDSAAEKRTEAIAEIIRDHPS